MKNKMFHFAPMLRFAPGYPTVQFFMLLFFYRRYVDDIFVLLKSENHVCTILTCVNTKHPNNKFTSEIKNSKFLAFLDIKVNRGHNKFETSVHLKSTFSATYTTVDPLLVLSIKNVSLFASPSKFAGNESCLDAQSDFFTLIP